jgi:hypothetical protein
VTEPFAEEERIGRVVVRTASRHGKQDYREPALLPVLEIERGALPMRLSRAQLVATLIALFITIAIAIFGIYSRERAILGASPIPLVALVIGAIIHVRETRRALVRVGRRELAASALGPSRRILLDRIEGLGSGIDQKQATLEQRRTLWIRVRDEGRLPLLDALTEEEAALASRRLREALEIA